MFSILSDLTNGRHVKAITSHGSRVVWTDQAGAAYVFGSAEEALKVRDGLLPRLREVLSVQSMGEAMEAEMADQVVDAAGRTRGQLQAAFSKVTDPADWRGRINWVGSPSADELGAIVSAIEFFTGTVAEVVPVGSKGWNGEDVVQVISQGYRLGPCGP